MPFCIMLFFLNNVLREINTLSSLLSFDIISGAKDRLNLLQTSWTDNFGFLC